MRTLLLALALLAASCRSSTDIIDTRVLGCESGGDLMIRAGLQGFGTGGERLDDRLTMFVEVSNNARHEVFVKQIRIEQPDANTRGYRLDSLLLNVDRTIAEDDDYTFELPMTGRGVRNLNDPVIDGQLDVVLSLYLGNGDVYRCPVQVPLQR